ncbi:Guanosine polyphosphate pyrophosphohydrolase/synthetase [Planctomycetales bacterium 10988]|nr:Guanosine polyphosphate pyrophosphohydrolase/synthetase [Planctomycetales bacterium 10988]
METKTPYVIALDWVVELHGKQRRKVKDIPYITHLMSVSSLVWEAGGTETEAIAALLHDAAEDQGGEEILHQIEAKFGKKVSEIVAGCSDTFETPKPPWRERKETFLNSLRGASPSIHLVVGADKLHNLRELVAAYREEGERLWKHFRGGRATLWYYCQLGTYLQETTLSPRILNPLLANIRELHRLADEPCPLKKVPV